MYFALGAAAAGAVDLLSSLVPSKAAGKAKTNVTTGITQDTKTPFDVTSAAASSSTAAQRTGVTSQSGVLAPQTMSALFAAQDASQSTPTSKTDALKSLFGALDGNGDGQISKSEFADKLGAGGTNTANANSVFGKLDTDGNGSVSLDELTAALTTKKGHGAKHAQGGDGGKGGEDALMKALDGASSTSTSNSDGSTTTTMTYADGSTVTLTTPPASDKNGASKSASASYNLVEQMIQKQAESLALSAKQSISIKA